MFFPLFSLKNHFQFSSMYFYPGLVLGLQLQLLHLKQDFVGVDLMFLFYFSYNCNRYIEKIDIFLLTSLAVNNLIAENCNISSLLIKGGLVSISSTFYARIFRTNFGAKAKT
jgi:hypothetical protein